MNSLLPTTATSCGSGGPPPDPAIPSPAPIWVRITYTRPTADSAGNTYGVFLEGIVPSCTGFNAVIDNTGFQNVAGTFVMDIDPSTVAPGGNVTLASRGYWELFASTGGTPTQGFSVKVEIWYPAASPSSGRSWAAVIGD